MRIQKYNVKLSGIICITSFIIALILNQLSIGFWSNIFIGIFSSGILVLLLSVATYRIEKRKTLESFYTCTMDIINNIKKYEKNDNPEITMESVLEMNKFNYANFDLLFGDIEFLFNDKKNRSYIYKNIYVKILDIRDLLARKSFHFNEFKRARNGNLPVMEQFISEIDSVLMERSIIIKENNEGNETTLRCSYNKLAEELSKELRGRFYELMYGKNN